MKELGKINSLLINRFTANGAYLALHDGEEVLLPKSYLQEDFKEGQEVEVFVYTDSEDRPVAVTNRPVALLDEFAVMEAKEITRFGAFMDWGLPKDLFVPKSEMHVDMEEGEKYLVRVCMDFKTDRLIGVSKYEDFLELETRGFEEGQEVEALIFAETDLGFKALIENAFEGLIYKNEVFTTIELGDKVRAFVKKRREDGKLDLRLEPIGREKYEEGAEKILSVLKVKKFLPLHDKSSPESIKELLGMSKKHFKQSIGQLYKAKIIKILDNGIELV
ncbi:S1-like domain-containing RNA-binding protein [Belliella sp. R4-6]|uniref:S1-like domain-containing RNA-binding protein n=1 Tax=Belliella alkalica TaxID=1730871 RepID=A0ABS9V6X1_9BACT|nr:S1-like domain-containing RNA-binding protein [Belliella alkalica]MCH7412167.1 S1-like domain-containing RNA-binding protein [Belliella alkalica]